MRWLSILSLRAAFRHRVLPGGAFLLFVLLVGTPWASAQSVIREYDPYRHDRYRARGPDDPAFILEGYDLSGIGRAHYDVGRWVTMISNQVFLTANHFHPDIGRDIWFYHGNSQVNEEREIRKVVAGAQIIGTDIWVGLLNEPVSEKVTHYPLAELGRGPLRSAWQTYSGEQIFAVGRASVYIHPQRVGTNDIDDNTSELGVKQFTVNFGGDIGQLTMWGYTYAYDDPPEGGNPDEIRVVYADSGGPSFIMVDGQLHLAGIHLGEDTTGDGLKYSVDTLLEPYAAEIEATKQALLNASTRVLSFKRLSATNFEMTFSSIPGASYAIRAAESPEGPYTTVLDPEGTAIVIDAHPSNDFTTVQFTDANASAMTKCFYRAEPR